MVFIIDKLERLEFIIQKKGYGIKSGCKRYSTKMMPTFKFYQFCLQNRVDQRSFLGDIQTINTKKDELVFKEPKKYSHIHGETRTESKSIDVSKKKKTQQIQRMLKDVKRQNELSEIFQAKLNITEYEKYHLFKLIGKYDEILDTRCYRVFTDCMEGSIYSRYVRYGGR